MCRKGLSNEQPYFLRKLFMPVVCLFFQCPNKPLNSTCLFVVHKIQIKQVHVYMNGISNKYDFLHVLKSSIYTYC